MAKDKNQKVDLTRFKYIMKGLCVGLIVGFIVSLFRLVIEFSLHFVLNIYRLMRTHPIIILPWILIMIIIAVINSRLIKKEPNIILVLGFLKLKVSLLGNLK